MSHKVNYITLTVSESHNFNKLYAFESAELSQVVEFPRYHFVGHRPRLSPAKKTATGAAGLVALIQEIATRQPAGSVVIVLTRDAGMPVNVWVDVWVDETCPRNQGARLTALFG